MKIDRRCFLSFVAGGAAGTALSPLPWKLMDDFSIWTQNWPWVPVPREGKSTYTNTTCSLCPGGCGITVRKVNNRAVKIEGIKGHPINNGGICGLGLSGLQLLYGPTRVKSPLRRDGSRGSGKWQKISWDEAISIVTNKLKSIRSDGDADKVACISGDIGGSVFSLLKRFFQSYGSTNFIQIPSGYNINKLVMKSIFGFDSDIDFDFKNSDFILSFGSGLVDGWVSPVRMIKEKSLWVDKKAKLVQIESNLSNTAAKSDIWIPINPGTEADLAFGIAAFMLENNLYDLEFISKRAVNFNNWKQDIISNYSLKSVSRTTGIDVDDIIRISKSFANADRPIAICGCGKGLEPSSFRDYSSTALLNLLSGSINKAGGILLYEENNYINWPEIIFDDIAKANLGDNNQLNHSLSDLKSKESLKALFISNSNPLYTLPDTKSNKKFFKSIPFIVSFSSFMDESSMESDIILPNHVYLERLEDIPILIGSGKTTIGLSKPVVSAQFNTRHLGDTLIDISNAFGGTISKSFPWKNYEECLDRSLGSKFESIFSNGIWTDNAPKVKEIIKFTFKWADISPIEAEGNPNLFPLLLLPSDSLRLSSSEIASPPFLVKIISDTVIKGNIGFVDINPQTAEALGLSDGGSVILSTPKGEAKVRIHFYDGVKPGVLIMAKGLGHKAYDDYIADKGTNVNDLLGSNKDPVLGHDTFWGIRARLNKA